MVFAYYSKISSTGAEIHNRILMSLLFLVAETKIIFALATLSTVLGEIKTRDDFDTLHSYKTYFLPITH